MDRPCEGSLCWPRKLPRDEMGSFVCVEGLEPLVI